MKILHISHLYPVFYDKFYGKAIHSQIKEIAKRGVDAKVISPIPWTPFPIQYLSSKWKKYSEIPRKTFWEGIEVYHPRYLDFPKALFFSSSGKRMYRGIQKLVDEIYKGDLVSRFARNKSFKFDLIHAHMALPDGYAAVLLKEKYKKPLILSLRSSDLNISIFRNKKIFNIIQRVANQANTVLVPSPYLQKRARKYLNIDPIVVPNGIDLNDIFQGKSRILEKYRGKRIILSASRLIKIKGIDFNLRAIARLKEKYPNLLYLIIGDGPEKRSLENLVKDLKIEKEVEFLGPQSHKKTMEYMSICDIFSTPSWQETFGLVYLEAMANGKPVIGCQDQGVDGIVKEKETGLLVKQKDVDSLVIAIDFLLSNPEKAKEIGERAKKLVLENYTWEKAIKKLVGIYKNLT